MSARQATVVTKRLLRQMGFESPKVRSRLIDFEDLARRKRVFVELVDPDFCELTVEQRRQLAEHLAQFNWFLQEKHCFGGL